MTYTQLEPRRDCTKPSRATTPRRESGSSRRGLSNTLPFRRPSSQTSFMVGVGRGSRQDTLNLWPRPKQLQSSTLEGNPRPGSFRRWVTGFQALYIHVWVCATHSARVGTGGPGPSLPNPFKIDILSIYLVPRSELAQGVRGSPETPTIPCSQGVSSPALGSFP